MRQGQVTGQPEPQRQSDANSGYGALGMFSTTGPMKSKATYLHATVDGSEHDCLLDTGSEVSVLPAFLVRNDLIQPTTQKLRAANGTEIGVLGHASVPFRTPLYYNDHWSGVGPHR